MSRLIVLIKKNLMRFIRNPKTLGFLILIPVIYYLLLGLIFGGIDFSDTTTTYNIGWIDDDTTNENYGIHPQFNLSYIYEVTDEINGINLVNYSSLEEAKQAALEGTITAYLYFPEGYESYLENRSFVNIAFWNNDTSTSANFSILDFYISLVSTTSHLFKFTYYNKTEGNNILSDFNNYNYDGMLIINQIS